MYTAYPIILDYIKKNKKGVSKKVLEYGCGTGTFCRKLPSSGFEPIGIDISPKMISIAKKHNKSIHFFVGDSKKAVKLSGKREKFGFVVAIMVFQFIEDIRSCIEDLSNCLEKNGHIIFAVHNPKKMRERKITNKLKLEDKEVDIYIRSSKDYDKMFNSLGFSKKLEKYPKTSEEFLKKYTQKDSLRISKYMILAYKK